MTPSLAVQFSGAENGRKIIIDENVLLVGVVPSSTTNRVAVSRDAGTTIANAFTGPANTTDENIIALSGGIPTIPISVPISAGQSVFVSSSAAGSAMLYFAAPNLS